MIMNIIKKVKIYITLLMCFLVMLPHFTNKDVVIKAIEGDKNCVGYWILKEGETRPATFDEISEKGWYWGDWGSAEDVITVMGDSKRVTKIASGVPKTAQKMLKEGQEFEWFAMQRKGYRYQIYGQIVEKKAEPTPTIEPTATPLSTYNPQEHKTKYANFYILKKGQSMPQFVDALPLYKWEKRSGGAIWQEPDNDIEVFDDVRLAESRIYKEPDSIKDLIGKNEEVRYFAIKSNTSRESWVYGIICEKGTKVEHLADVDPVIDATNPDSYNNYPKYYTRYYVSDELGLETPKSIDDLSNYKWNTTPNYNMRSGYSTKLRRVVGEENVLPLLISGVPTASELALQKDEDIHWVAMNTNGNSCIVYGIIYNKKVEASIKAGAKISKETSITVDTLQDLKNLQEVYPAGAKIYTKGYYEAGDGGAATYEVAYRSSGGYFSSLTTKTGQHVNFVIENKTINLLQFGAGRCKAMIDNVTDLTDNDDAARLNEAIGLIDKYDDGVIEIPEGELRCASKVYIGGDHYKIVGKGKTSILYTDNGYQGDEHFLTVVGKDITLDNFRVEARETKWVPYYRQCSVMFASDIQILNCEFSVKKNVIAFNGNTDRQYTNITLYTDWHNVKIDNCFMEQMGCVERGACLGLLDIWSNGCTNAKVTNCTMIQNAHDEMLGIFTASNKDSAGIKNVIIENNKMYSASAPNVSKKTMVMTVAYDSSKNISDIYFRKNYMEVSIPSNMMTFGSLQNCVIEDNKFVVNNPYTSRANVLFDGRKGVTIKNNDITMSGNGGFGTVVKNDTVFENNTVNSDVNVSMIAYKGTVVRDNKFYMNKGVYEVARSPKEFVNNYLETRDGIINNFFHYDSISYNSDVTDNTIIYDYDDTGNDKGLAFSNALVYAGFHAGLNNNTITFSRNTIKATCEQKNKSVLAYGYGDETPQTFIIEDNKLDKFYDVRSIYYQKGNVVFNNNVDADGNLLDLDRCSINGMNPR